MTEEQKIEELMKPRYKVIADYPGASFIVGSILEPEVAVHYVMNNEELEYEKFPHLFRKLEWWQEREASEMPGYVKWVAQCHEKGMVEPVIEWHKRTQHWAANVQSQVNSIRAEYFEPATEADYQAYITKPINQD